MNIKTLMTSTTATIRPESALGEAMALMARTGTTDLPVVRDGALVGLLRERDARLAGPSTVPALRQHDIADPLSGLTVGEVMTRAVCHVTPGASIPEALRVAAGAEARSLPVVDAGIFMGIVTTRDLLAHLVRMIEERSPAPRSHFLVALTFSESDAATLAAARTLARRSNTRLTAMHVVPPLPRRAVDGIPDAVRAQVAAARERSALADLQELATADADVTLDSWVTTGDEPTELARAATDLGADLIVMAKPAARGLWRWLARSVVEETVRCAPCPVLAVPA